MEPTPLTPLWPSFEYRPHQAAAIEWMRTQEEDPYLPGGLLCDEMGLGKTMEVLGLIKNTKVSMNLLISPLAVLEQWTEAAVRSGINVFRMSYKRDWEAIGTHTKKTTFLFITHYDFAMRHNDELMTTVWHRIILDEAHRICNERTLLFEAIHQIPAKNKWALTATPIINGLPNANALFQFLGMDKTQIPQSTKRLAPIIFEKTLCRTVAELRPMIPSLPQKEVIHYHTLPFSTKDERDFYRGIQGAAVRRWTALQEEGAGRMAILKLLLVLRQISVHPQVYINACRRNIPYYTRTDWPLDSTKFSKIKSLLTEQSEEPHKWLIFANFHDEMDMIQTTLRSLPRVKRVQTYSGRQTQAQREAILEKTKEPLDEQSTEVLILQLQSGSVGLNLQHFDRIIFISPWWTKALMDQAIGRAVRIGQKGVVQVHHIHLEEETRPDLISIDKLMNDKAAAKGELCKWFLDSANHLLEVAAPLPL